MKRIFKIINRIQCWLKLTWYKVRYMKCISKVDGILKGSVPDSVIFSSQNMIATLCAMGIDPVIIAQLVHENYYFNLICDRFPDGLSDDEKKIILDLLKGDLSLDKIVEKINESRKKDKKNIDVLKKS